MMYCGQFLLTVCGVGVGSCVKRGERSEQPCVGRVSLEFCSLVETTLG